MREYNAHKDRQLHGKFSNFKSVSQKIKDFYDYEYCVNLTIGTPSQSFSVFLNITSGNLVVPDIKCGNCTRVKRFDPSKSSTYQKTNYYLSNNSSYGVYGQDFVRIGNTGGDQLIIPNSMFGQALTHGASTDYDGILGLGFTAENPDGIDSPITTAIKSGILDYPIVTLFFNHIGEFNVSTKGGVITYGAVDTANCDHNVVYEPLTDPNKFQIAIKNVAFGSNSFSRNWNASIDNNDYAITAPADVANALAAEINATYNGALYFVNCTTQFNFNITIGNTVYTLTENKMVIFDYFIGCYLALYPNNVDTWILGGPWMESVCNVLDYGNKRVGFATPIAS